MPRLVKCVWQPLMLAVRADMQDAFGVSIRRDERVDFTQGEQAVIKFDVPENLRSIAFTLNGSVKVCHVLYVGA